MRNLIPTMKPLDTDKKPETAEDKPAEAAPAAPAAAPAARQPEIHFEDDAPLDEEVN